MSGLRLTLFGLGGLGLGWVLSTAAHRRAVARPLVALVTAGLAVGAALAFDGLLVPAVAALFSAVLAAAAAVDARYRIIPNRLLYPSLLAFVPLVAVLWVGGHASLARAGLGLLGFAGGMLLLHLLHPGGIGMGDVKLAALIGLVLGAFGWRYLQVGVLLGALAGALWGAGLLVAGRGLRAQFPYGPFLAAGAVAALLLGPRWLPG
ncbi:MAG TPA: prepilin peptidase [Actinomycetota bacterium]|nr:prepilin peptidase [Actinomycetota bacterium]